ncbi:MAG: hypothetical protein K2P81_02085 [Bacteriovoracaceae bacterium]|nr:hypothetical protein [Bacteriovoracaceae bacterium]
MKPYRINIDFEEFISGKPRKPSLNSTIEFLFFSLTDHPILIHRKYSTDYLTHIESFRGFKAHIAESGEAVDYWGETKNIPLMKELSSKVNFLHWWDKRQKVHGFEVKSWDQVVEKVTTGEWLFKVSDGMSGRGHLKIHSNLLLQNKEKIEKMILKGVVLEPLLERVQDLSALWLPDEKKYQFYTNIVDERFQWRGSIIDVNQMNQPPKETLNWAEDLKVLQKEISLKGYEGVFSVDAFFYTLDGHLHFHPGSEINPRKTMGWISYQLWKKNQSAFAGLRLFPISLTVTQWRELKYQKEVFVISPEESLFTWIWVEANSRHEMEEKIKRFATKLPEAPNRGKA